MTLFPIVHNLYHNTAPSDAVYVGRGSLWGNPFVIGKDGTREEVIEKFKQFILPTLDLIPLKDKDLICFCKPKACHADLLIEEANKKMRKTERFTFRLNERVCCASILCASSRCNSVTGRPRKRDAGCPGRRFPTHLGATKGKILH
jgi:hypothetical protein